MKYTFYVTLVPKREEKKQFLRHARKVKLVPLEQKQKKIDEIPVYAGDTKGLRVDVSVENTKLQERNGLMFLSLTPLCDL